MHIRFTLAIIGLLLTSILNGKPSVTIGDTLFVLANEEGGADGQLREFLKPDETFEHWTRLVAIRHITKLDDPKSYIDAMARQYHAKRPHMQFAMMQDIARKDWIIDFIEYPDSGKLKFMEWNYFRAHKSSQGLIVYQYAVRYYYKKRIDELGNQIGETRKAMLGVLLKSDFSESESRTKR
jgi:hypothetical protein